MAQNPQPDRTIRLSGHLICASVHELELVRRYLPEHVRLTRAEPGCLSFDVVQTDDPMVWRVDERFTDMRAFKAHQDRTRASEWGRRSSGIGRDFQLQIRQHAAPKG